MAQNETQNEGDNRITGKPWWYFWTDYHREIKHLEIDYNVREREKQISKIVDDDGFKFIVFLVAASGFLASSYSLFATNVIMPSLYYVYPPCGRLSSNASEVIDEVTLVGIVVGMLLMGHIVDRSGRKRWYGVELSILIAATVGMVQASEGFMVQNPDGTYAHSMDIYSWILWWRFMLGFGIGSEYPLSAIITSEWASTESRGTMLASVFSMQSVGRLLAFAIGLGALRITSQKWGLQPNALTPDKSKLVVDQVWRWTIGIAVIPAAIAIFLRRTTPETPRYYADIMKNLRKAVKNAMKVYGRNKNVTEKNSTTNFPVRQNSDDEGDHWYGGAWKYLTGKDKAWRRLAALSLLWALMDAAWYGLSMDTPSALSTLAYDAADNSTSYNFKRSDMFNAKLRREDKGICSNSSLWNTDFWNLNDTIYDMLQENSLRSILVVSIASLVGSIVAILIINIFRRKYILVVTFLMLSVFFAIAGASLIATEKAEQAHNLTTVFYAILQFTFNLGPNPLIFTLGAEIFPTVYRGTFYGIAAASGKVGAIIIRAVIAATTNDEMSLGIRLLVFIPLMLVSALISWYLPDVQVVPGSNQTGAGTDEQVDSDGQQHVAAQKSPSDRTQQRVSAGNVQSDQDSNASLESPVAQPRAAVERLPFLGRLKNMALEDIAPNPLGVEK